MSRASWKLPALMSLALLVGAAGGYWFAAQRGPDGVPTVTDGNRGAPAAERQPLYWYDPMFPQQKFDSPGKSPFMDMQLVPRYADEMGESTAVRIEPGIQQNLGVRLASVTKGKLEQSLQVSGVLAFNAREVALVQARAGGFVERTYVRAPGDLIAAGEPLADLLIPEWAAAQEEFLALRRSGDPAMSAAARQRLRLIGMPPELITRVERGGKARPVMTLTSPISGVIRELDVRIGMTLSAGQTLARINGLEHVWLEAAIPESQAGALQIGQTVEARLPALPGEVIHGALSSVLPESDPQSRTLRVRVELANPDGRLRPGMTAQVRLNQSSQTDLLLLPSEAVIRTGKRALVMLVEENGRFRPVEVQLGQESEGQVAVLEGLAAGQQVVASGQFLIDSEASLRGIEARALGKPTMPIDRPTLHEAEGSIVEVGAQELTISHGPFKTLGMPGMTMTFPLARPELARGLKAGDRISLKVREGNSGLLIEQLEKLESAP
ncbi:efflux RND transporter periplasmic adaptor subunit [Metapseudomonas furukawaii]|uniref:Cobalt/zinc/cadmium efflux RND transporter n=1 Tax=Metapseudomonas furukawaii TaxID=1149133 RepID=A0AAD1C1N0_METFU|nr:efflux RND transporter periplasmic adaptor subunit [Pseudomonas furukawaii]ELS25501.1 Cobalt/zinc/cadmium efflux RND transporter, membrane fusion protein, CzcB family [Pseudomonas furukawaii]BAU75799.1 cobalt/zinc/cadmium efflux RND transporter [Pseudomonas furukawaii]